MPLCVSPRPGSRASLGLVCLQADSPEDMHSWIRAITGAVQALKTRPRVRSCTLCFVCSVKCRLCQCARYLFSGLSNQPHSALSLQEMSFVRSTSMARPGGSSAPSQPRAVAEERRALCKAPSTSSWQPWTPVPQAEGQRPALGELPAPLRDSVFVPALVECGGRATAGTRLRHRSEPQHLKEKPFAFDLDDESIRTSDV